MTIRAHPTVETMTPVTRESESIGFFFFVGRNMQSAAYRIQSSARRSINNAV